MIIEPFMTQGAIPPTVSSVHDQVSISLPLVRSKHACSKLSECFDYCVIIVCASLDTTHQLIASTVHQGGLHIMDFKHIGGEQGDVGVVILSSRVVGPL